MTVHGGLCVSVRQQWADGCVPCEGQSEPGVGRDFTSLVIATGGACGEAAQLTPGLCVHLLVSIDPRPGTCVVPSQTCQAQTSDMPRSDPSELCPPGDHIGAGWEPHRCRWKLPRVKDMGQDTWPEERPAGLPQKGALPWWLWPERTCPISLATSVGVAY